MTVKCPKCHSENPDTLKFCGECGTQLIPSPKDVRPEVTETLQTAIHELTTGSTFAGRYQIIEELGKGGMGKVYKVFDQEVQAKMALKLIRPEVSADKSTIDRFRNELKIARDISHKNICRMYDLGREAGSYFITMEYVSGEDLKSFIRRARQLVVGTAILIAKQVCDGLAEAHRAGVVHRDLKPGNIMIDKEGNAKIMDFGIARSISAKGITGAGVMIGTPEYMSPEQVEGKEVDERSDIYSLGIILYEMLTGQVPFEGDTPFTIGVKQKSEIPKDPKSLNAQIPEDLSWLILKCLEKDKERRYQSADELKDNLEKIEKGIPNAERPVPRRKTLTSKPITLTVSRKKLFVPLSVVLTVAAIAIGLRVFLPKRHAVPPPSSRPSLAVLYFENISGDKSLDAWKTGLTELLITKLNQSRFIRVLDGATIYGILKKLNLDEAKKYTKADLVKVADEGGATHTISGSLMKAGQNIIITLTLQKPYTGDVISSIPVECNSEKEIMVKVDEVARKIKSDLNLSPEQISTDIDKDIGIITTSSPEAYKYYVEGIKYDLAGDYRKQIEFMEKAVSADPKFASAYHAMSWANGNLGNAAEARTNIQKALELSERLSDRERYVIQGDYYLRSEKTWDRAMKVFEKLLDLYPDDMLGNNQLAVLYSGIGEIDKAIERIDHCIKNKTQDVMMYRNQAHLYMAKGWPDKARDILEYYIDNISDSAFVRRFLARNYREQGKLDLALAEVNKAFSLAPTDWSNISSKGDIYVYSGDLGKAEEEYEKLLELKTSGAIAFRVGTAGLASLYMLEGKYKAAREKIQAGIEQVEKLGPNDLIRSWRGILADVDLRSGRPEQALDELKSVWTSAIEDEDFGAQRSNLYSQGLAYLAKKSIPEAQNEAEKLKGMIEQGMNKKLMSLYYHLQGSIEFEKGDSSQAIEYFKKGLPLLPVTSGLVTSDLNMVFAESLGMAYLKAGELESAQREYERIAQMMIGRIEHGDIYAGSFYMLGKIAEQQGDKVRARENFQRFLDLWKDADAGLPEVEDARKRLAGLSQ